MSAIVQFSKLVYNAIVWKLTDICLCAEDYKLSEIICNLICKYEINSKFYGVLELRSQNLVN